MDMMPEFVYPSLWSYDVAALDIERDKKRIITNILNLGTKQATNWLFGVYTKEDIQECITNPLPGEWNKKSLFFWAFLMDVQPGNASKRIIP